ncbi:MAG: MFS transporter [Chloroflexi bacterium]|nr:MFS transporter [Chloroflexota bacterium]
MQLYANLLRRNRDLRFIWFAEIISLVGDWFSQLVLLALVVSLSPGREGFAISTLILARFVPPLFLSPYAGVLLDRFNRQRLLVWSNYLRGAVGFLYLVAIADPALLWLIYLGVILQGILGTVYMPGQSALVAGVVAQEDLVVANTLSSATWSAALAAGGALAGFVGAAFGSAAALLFDALTFFVAGLLLSQVKGYVFVKPAPKPAAVPDPASAPEHDASLGESLRYVRAHRPTLATLFVKFGGSLGNVDAVMTVLGTQLFVLGAKGQLSLGIMYSAFGVGAILGPLLANILSDGTGRTLRRWILIGFIAQAAGWVILGWAGVLFVVCLGLMLRGMGGSLNWTYSSVLLQRTTPDHFRGRVFALDMTLFNLATVFSTIVQGALIDALGPSNIVIIAIGTAVLSLFPLIGWAWAQRGWPERSPGLERAQQIADA